MIYLGYIIYLILSSSIVLWVGNACYKNGKVFISNYFIDQHETGYRINRLLRIAYYLLNIGLTFFCLYSIDNVQNLESMITEVSQLIGIILLIIGGLHFNNIIIISLLHKYFKN